jgi:hypothetical protein
MQGRASYTWSRSIDNGSWESGLFLVESGMTAEGDRANSSFHVRQSLAAGLSYELAVFVAVGRRR